MSLLASVLNKYIYKKNLTLLLKLTNLTFITVWFTELKKQHKVIDANNAPVRDEHRAYSGDGTH